METANHTAMHVTETKTLCSSLTCSQSKSEEITKDQEEELLCGNSEDGDEEDALSDDSMRLRLSDDEAELDEPAASENVIIKKAGQEGTNMELGSDVPPTDTSDQISALRIQKISNGNCTFESKNMRVNQEDQESNDAFAEDTVPSADNFIDFSDISKNCNGDSSQMENKSTEGALITQMQGNKWKISGHFGEYSNRANRIPHSRKPYSESNKYATDPYNDKYYNKNTYYGGGKGSGRTNNSYFRESLSRDGTDEGKYLPRVPSPNIATKESASTQIADVSCSPKKFEFPTTTPSESDNQLANHLESESSEPIKTDESINNGEDTSGLSKNDDENIKAASDGVDNLASEEVPENLDPNPENPPADLIVDQESVVKTEVEDANASNCSISTLVVDNLNNSIAERLNENVDVTGEVESKSANPKELNSEEADLNSEEADNGSQKMDETVLSDNSDQCTKAVPSGEVSDAENAVEEEVVVEEIETESAVMVESNDRNSLERAEDELTKEIEKFDDPKEVNDEKFEENEPSETEPPKSKFPAEEMEKRQEEPDAVSADTEKQSEVVESEQALKEPSIVATDDSETVEKAVASVDNKSEKVLKEPSIVATDDSETVEKAVASVDKKSEQALKEPSIVATDDSETVEKGDASADKEVPSEPKILDIEDHIADLPDEMETSSDDEGEINNVRILHSSLKRTPTELLDEMELFKRIRIQRKKTESDVPTGKDITEESVSTTETDVINKTNNSASTVVNPVTNSIADSKSPSESEASLISNTVVENSSDELAGQSKDVKLRLIDCKENIEKVEDCEVVEIPVKKKQKRNRRSLQTARDSVVSQEDTQEKENVRQKRRTAKNAEEIIRKEFLGNSDSESNDSAGNFVAVNYNKNSNNLRAASPPSLKRNYVEEDEKLENLTIKKLKQDLDSNGDVSMKNEALPVDKVQTLAHVRKFFRRDDNGKLAKLKQEELEELLIQKVVETITMRDEIGKLREQAKISERNQEATRIKCQQLAKQIKDFEMVLNRFQSDRRSNPEKNVVPIKINRSVGLQVNFVTQEHGIQNLRQLAQTQKAAPPTVNGAKSPQQSEQPPNAVPIVKRTLKVRSPRRPEPPVAVPTVTTVSTPVHSQPIISNITPATLLVTKNVTDSRTPVTPTVQHTTVPHPIAPKQTILLNGQITNQPIRQAATIQVTRTNNSDLIDLTQEEDKTKTTIVPQNTILATGINETPSSISNVQKIAPRYHTVIQTLPGSVAITAQSGIRVVQPSSQPTPTALVNNMNAPRLAYVMQGGMGSTRQVVVTSAPAPIRPAPTIRTSYPLSGTITNGTVRVIPMTSAATIQVYKHPAALPESLNSPSNPMWKLPPPAPSLKISKVANGIVLSWNMALSEKYAEIASYQLYAYQEVSGIAPSSTLWKKVGDVRALPLPMACTLTQFSEGNNYYFAVRAVDKHSRLGLYSQPGNISL